MPKKKLINKSHHQKPLLFKKHLKRLLFVFVFILILPFLYYLLVSVVFFNRIYPNVYIANISLGGYKKVDAETVLKDSALVPDNILFSKEGTSLKEDMKINPSDIGLTYNYLGSIDRAFAAYRSTNRSNDFLLKFSFLKDLTTKSSIKLPLVFLYDVSRLDSFFNELSSLIYIDPTYPSIKVISGRIVVDKGTLGQELDKKAMEYRFVQIFSWLDKPDIPIVIKHIDVTLTPEEVTNTYNRSNILYTRRLTANLEENTFSYTKAAILKFLNPKIGYNQDEILNTITSITKEVEREPQNPVFKYEGGVVKEFLPALDGVRVNTESFNTVFLDSLEKLEKENQKEVAINIPVTKTPPPNKTEDVNSLGIKELIGTGISYFKGSILSRIHNVGLATSKFNGILVAPGETFSFNKILSDVSQFTGYQQAYIIRDGKTILGDGGGVCQVSTTFFRAALDAGLPIVERRAHSYRVGYYEQYSPPGIDATVFDPTSDLKIKNDTANHLLIQTKINIKALKLTFEIYGTKDGRVVEISKPVVSKPVPPPDDLYTDDPTLPVGQTKQIDWKAWGAKVIFNYKVTKGQETLFEKTFVSNYQPWQAKFLRGTGPVI